jgi:LuxR family transcriptional regulator, maltose regulon positive regulatory protein
MAVPLLTTKLYIPPVRSEWVPRPQLIERLNDGLADRKLILVSAPAGSGKTSLVTAWLSTSPASDHRIAWLSLDDVDNDPHRFFAYLLAALQTADPEIGGDALRLLEASQRPIGESLVTSLINDICLSSPLILVLDDYHAIVELAIHEAVDLLLDRQPPHMHLVIVTRHDPPLSLPRLRGRDQLIEIRQADLRFSSEEAAVFLNQSMGLGLQPPEVSSLEESTEGWITGLQLAALSMRGRDAAGIARFLAAFSGRHHFILDYLGDEVLQRQPPALQEFLLKTSILERLSGSLCDAVLAHRAPGTAAPDLDGGAPGSRTPSSQSILEHLEAANLFIVPLDDERRWYRNHHLFAELLRARLQEIHPDLIPELHRGAVAWYEQSGLHSDAVHHALASQDASLAGSTVERAILSIATWSRANVAIMRRWLEALPHEVLQARPWLRLFKSRILYVAGQPELARQTLQSLEEWLHAHAMAPDGARILKLAQVDRASYAAVLGHVHEAKEMVRETLARVPEADPITRFRAPAILGLAHARAGEVSEAHRAFAEASDIALEAGLNYAAIPFLCNLAEVETVQGRLRQARETLERAGELALVDGAPLSVAGFVGLGLSKILYEWNELHAAERHLLDGLELLRQGGISESFGNGYALLALIQQALGDEEGARTAAGQAVQIAERENIPRLIGLTSAYRARVWLAQGQLGLASRWAAGYRQAGDTEYLREFEDLTLARVLLGEGRSSEALHLLDLVLAPALTAGRMSTVVEIQALRPLALPASDDALDELGRALSLAEPEGYIQRFVEQGEAMRALLRQAAVRGIAPVYAGRLLAAFGPEGGSGAVTRSPQLLVEPLSDRELEVLAFLSEGLPNREIGRRLFISLPTVKSHTLNIYGKLGVHSRAEAVARARALGLLPS